MQKNPTKSRRPEETKRKLIDATLHLMLKQGFAGTTVDQICAEAGLTKGGFFHHYESKEALGLAAVDAWGAFGTGLYAEAWKDPKLDPLEQIHKLFDIMTGFNKRNEPCLCMVGMMSQEMSLQNSPLRAACERHLTDWANMFIRMLTAAKKIHAPAINFDPGKVAWLLNSIWQGSMLIGKTRQRPQMIIDNLKLARACVDSLFA